MPTGKVKWYDTEKGFGFISNDDGGDVFVPSSALPEGVPSLKPGTRVDFGVAQGRKGDQALQVRIVEAPKSVAKSVAKAKRKSPADMVNIVEDLYRLLGASSAATARGARRPKTAKPTAMLLRALADELEA